MKYLSHILVLVTCLFSTLGAAEDLKTKKISIKKEKHNEYQVAIYKDAKKFHYPKRLKVKTCLQDRYGIISGNQEIYHGKKKISESHKIRTTKIGKTSYVVHIHPHMTVYSNDNKQFIRFSN
jgi:hypothetical protein